MLFIRAALIRRGVFTAGPGALAHGRVRPGLGHPVGSSCGGTRLAAQVLLLIGEGHEHQGV